MAFRAKKKKNKVNTEVIKFNFRHNNPLSQAGKCKIGVIYGVVN